MTCDCDAFLEAKTIRHTNCDRGKHGALCLGRLLGMFGDGRLGRGDGGSCRQTIWVAPIVHPMVFERHRDGNHYRSLGYFEKSQSRGVATAEVYTPHETRP